MPASDHEQTCKERAGADQKIAARAVCDGEGNFVITGLTPGDYYLFATASRAVSHVPGWLYPDRPCTVRFVGWPTPG